MSPVFSTYNLIFIFSVVLNGILHPEKKSLFVLPTMKHCIMSVSIYLTVPLPLWH